MGRIIAFLLATSNLITLTPSASADWPEFRGPNQNGTADVDTLPQRWSETENVVWHTPTVGLGWSSPVVYGGKIYLTTSKSVDANNPSALRGSQSLNLLVYDGTSGELNLDKPIFEQDENAPQVHGKNSHASPTLVIHNNRLFAHFGHQGTACCELDGTIVWSNREHVYPPTHGNGGSPIIAEDKLIVTCDGGDQPYTLALDIATGKEVWRTPRNVSADRPFSFGTPQYIQVNGRGQIISVGSNVVQALAPSNGKVIWSVSFDGFSVVPRPLYHHGLVVISTGFMAAKMLAIDPSGTGDVTKTHVKWSYPSAVPNTPSMVAAGDEIIMVSDGGVATSVNADTGKKKWQKRLGGNYSASPLLSGNRVYFQSEAGEAIVMRLGETPEELARNTLPGRIFASYAVIDNDLLIRTETGLYRIGER